MENSIRKLTDEEQRKVIFVMNDFFEKYILRESCNSKYITEYDVLMKEKNEAFKQSFFKDNTPSEIDSLMETCDDYINDEPFKAFGLIIMYDMFINECSFWPTNNPKLWNKLGKLKRKKVRMKPREYNGETWGTLLRLRKGIEKGPMCGENYENEVFYGTPPWCVEKKGKFIRYYLPDGTLRYEGTDYIWKRFSFLGFKYWWDFHKKNKRIWNSKTKEQQEAIRRNNQFITGYERI